MRNKRNIVSSQISNDENNVFSNIKSKYKFNTSETIRYLIRLYKNNGFESNNLINLNDVNHSDLTNIKKANGFTTNVEAVNYLIAKERKNAAKLGSWNY